MEALAYNIKIIRGISRLNQTEFGQVMKVSRAMQRSYEGGQAKPDALYMQRLSRLTQVKEEDLRSRKLQENEFVHVEFEQSEQAEEDDDADELPTGKLRVTLKDHVDEIKNSREELRKHNEFLQQVIRAALTDISVTLSKLLVESDDPNSETHQSHVGNSGKNLDQRTFRKRPYPGKSKDVVQASQQGNIHEADSKNKH